LCRANVEGVKVERSHEHHEQTAGHGAAHEDQENHDWSDEAFVADWIQHQEAQASERRPLFAKVRALIPKGLAERFRYGDLGAGPGDLDELILERFAGAHAVVIDGSAAMLSRAGERLARFGSRAECVQADLSNRAWIERVSGPFDAVVAARAVHHVGGAERIREFFAEVLGTLAPGGVFINLDYVRPSDPAFRQLGAWAGTDPDAEFQSASPHMDLPSTVEEQLAWLREVGFAAAECVYREFQTVIVVGIRDQLALTNHVSLP